MGIGDWGLGSWGWGGGGWGGGVGGWGVGGWPPPPPPNPQTPNPKSPIPNSLFSKVNNKFYFKLKILFVKKIYISLKLIIIYFTDLLYLHRIQNKTKHKYKFILSMILSISIS